MSNLEYIYSHYNETIAEHKECIKSRNSLFIWLFITLSVVVMSAITPESIATIITTVVRENYKVDITSQINILQTALWIICLYLTLRYYQRNIQIEKQYSYLAKLEEQLQKEKLNIDREGNDYLKDYPWVCDYIDWLYKWLFPLLHILSIIYKIFQDFNFNQSVTVCLVTNAIIFILCIIADIGYLAYLIKNRNKNQEMHKKELSLTNEINNSMKIKKKNYPKRKQ